MRTALALISMSPYFDKLGRIGFRRHILPSVISRMIVDMHFAAAYRAAYFISLLITFYVQYAILMISKIFTLNCLFKKRFDILDIERHLVHIPFVVLWLLLRMEQPMLFFNV